MGGYELGLDPDADMVLGQQTYFGVDDVAETITKLAQHGCKVTEEAENKGGGIITGSVERENGQRINLIYNPYIRPDQPLKHID